MKVLTKKRLFIVKHFDFLIVDLIAFILGFCISYLFRRSLSTNMYNQDRMLTYGIVAVVSFLVVEIFSENLNGIITRGLIREFQVVVMQMTMTWTIWLSILFFMHSIFALSRIFAVVTYLLCTLFLLLFRLAWKMICKFSRKSDSVMPKLLIVCEATKAQTVLNRLVSGAMGRQYEICAVVTNKSGEPDYHDWYPKEAGLENLDKYTSQLRVQYGYVELDNKNEEKAVIDRLLNAGMVVYRSLGDSALHYADQSIGQLDGRTVIVISGARASLVSRADQMWQQLKHKLIGERE